MSHQKVCQSIKQEITYTSSDSDEFEISPTKTNNNMVKVLRISCNLCGKSFKQKRALQSHVKVCNAATMELEHRTEPRDGVQHLKGLKRQPSEMRGIKSELNMVEDPDNTSAALNHVHDTSDNEKGCDESGESPVDQRRTYNTYTQSLKLQVIAYARVHGKTSASRKFKVPHSSVRRWASLEKQIKQQPRMKCGRELRATRNVPVTKLEVDLKNWILKRHKAGTQLTKEMITEKAKSFSVEKNIDKFNATRTWYFAFLNRHQLDRIVDVVVPGNDIPELPGKTVVQDLTCDQCGLIFKYRPSLRSHQETCMPESDKDLVKQSRDRWAVDNLEEQEDSFSESECRETVNSKNHKSRKSNVYSKAFKLKLVREAKLSGNRCTGRKYRVSESIVRRWREEEVTIQQLPSTRDNLPGKLSQAQLIKRKYKKRNELKTLKSVIEQDAVLSEVRNYKRYTCNICKAIFKVKTVFECHVEHCSTEVVSNEEAKRLELQQKLAQIKEKNKTKKKNTFPAGFKLQLIQEAKLKGTTYVAEKYNLHVGTVNRWRHREKILQKLPTEKVICLGGSKFPLLESWLKDWMVSNAKLGKVFVRSLIKRQACTFSESMKLYDFMCSDSWLKKFFKRHQLNELVTVITNVIPYICYSCGGSLKTDIEFESHMSVCNPDCIDYVCQEIPPDHDQGMMSSGVADPFHTQGSLAGDLQNQTYQDMDDDDEDNDDESYLPTPTDLPEKVTNKVLQVKQELVSPEERSAVQFQVPVVDSCAGGRVSTEAGGGARLQSCGQINEPQLDRIFEFLDHVRLAPTLTDQHPLDTKTKVTTSQKEAVDNDINWSRVAEELTDNEEDSETMDMDMDHMVDHSDEADMLSDAEDIRGVQKASAMAKIGPFTCGVCARVFNFKHTFDKHMRYHESQTRYECHVCEKTFAFKMQLLSHVETHKNRKSKKSTSNDAAGAGGGGRSKHGEQEHMCERCGRYLKGGPSYRYHMKLHFREDQSKCADCSMDVLCSEHLEQYRLHLDSTLSRPLSFKLKMIDLVKRGGNKSEIARKYGIATNSLRKWLSIEGRLRETEAKQVENFSLKRKYDFPEIESRLAVYLNKVYNGGEGITNDNVQEEARRIALEVGTEGFKPTIPWLASFKERFKEVVPLEVFNKRKPLRGCRKSYTVVEKAQVVAKTEEIGVGKTAKQLGLPRSTIRKWVKEKRLIYSHAYDGGGCSTATTAAATTYSMATDHHHQHQQPQQQQQQQQVVQNYQETVVNDGSYLGNNILHQGY